jgi:hypothetical protein
MPIFVPAPARSFDQVALLVPVLLGSPATGELRWAAIGFVTIVLATTMLLAHATYAGSRRARWWYSFWAWGHALLMQAWVLALVVGLVASFVRTGNAGYWAMALPLPILRLAAYGFLAGVLWRSRLAKVFLDGQASQRVQLVSFTSVALLVLVILWVLVLLTTPFWPR